LEDSIFAAQGIGSSLADAVISSSSAAAAAVAIFESARSLGILYAAGRWTSFSPCSLGLLPITVSYISTATNDTDDGNTIAPTLAFAAGLAMVFTALGVSASALGGVFGGVVVGDGGGGGGSSASALSALASLVGVLMGLQLLELIRVPLPSLDFGLRRIALAFDGGGTGRRRGRGGVGGGGGGSLFEENDGLVLGMMMTTTTAEEEDDDDDGGGDDDGEGYDATRALLVRTFLLGGTSALVASPCWASFASPHRHRRRCRRLMQAYCGRGVLNLKYIKLLSFYDLQFCFHSCAHTEILRDWSPFQSRGMYPPMYPQLRRLRILPKPLT